MTFPYHEKIIFITLAGSRAYGIETENSDVDLKGIFIASQNHYIGLKPIEKVIVHKQQGWFSYEKFWKSKPELKNIETEGTLYELQKFCNLALQCNPNILDCLFANEKDILYQNSIGNMLYKMRNSFLSKKCINPFRGYALGELQFAKKMQQEGLSLASDSTTDRPATVAEKMQEKARKMHKHMAHVVRLFQTFEELILTGNYQVKRSNINELKAIRNGAWNFEKLENFISEKENQLNNWIKNSPLPDEPNFEKIDTLCQKMIFLDFVNFAYNSTEAWLRAITDL